MRRLLLLAALLAVPVPAAGAFPPDCDRYADQPCFTVREILCDVDGVLAPLWLDDLPSRPQVCAD